MRSSTRFPAASIIFAYLGFEQADQLAGEVKDPQRNLPRAIIGAILLGTLIYVLLQVVFIGATPSNLISGHLGFAGINPDNPIAIGPFAGLAGVVGLAWLAAVLRARRVHLALRHRADLHDLDLPGGLRPGKEPVLPVDVHQDRQEWSSLVQPDRLGFVFGLVFLLPFPSWHSLVGLVTSASVLMYAGAPLALGAFRKVLPDANRPYRMPAAAVVSPIAFVVANLIIYWSGFETLWKLGVAIIIGYLLILMHFSDNPHAPKINWTKSAWLGAYLIGMGLISWTGQFGPENTAKAPVLVGHALGHRLQPGDLLLGHELRPDQGRDGRGHRRAGWRF